MRTVTAPWAVPGVTPPDAPSTNDARFVGYTIRGSYFCGHCAEIMPRRYWADYGRSPLTVDMMRPGIDTCERCGVILTTYVHTLAPEGTVPSPVYPIPAGVTLPAPGTDVAPCDWCDEPATFVEVETTTNEYGHTIRISERYCSLHYLAYGAPSHGTGWLHPNAPRITRITSPAN